MNREGSTTTRSAGWLRRFGSRIGLDRAPTDASPGEREPNENRSSNEGRTLLLVVASLSLAAAMCWWGRIPWQVALSSEALQHEEGLAWYVPIDPPPWLEVPSDDGDRPSRSTAELFEDEQPLGPAHSRHGAIRELGSGRFSHWRGGLYFSTSDGTDPTSNARRYRLRAHAGLAGPLRTATTICSLALALLLALRRLSPAARRRVALAVLLAIGLLQWWQAPGRWWLWIWLALWISLFTAVFLRLPRPRESVHGHRRAARIRLLLLVWSTALSLTAVEVVLRVAEAAEAWQQGAMPAQAMQSVRAKRNAGLGNWRAPSPSELASLLSEQGVDIPEEDLRRITARRDLLTMPAGLEARSLDVEGAARALLWHGALHVFDENGFRRTEPFPAKSGPRIVVLGDSLTYGVGVEESATYVERMAEELSSHADIEVLNLGRPGAQSGDILTIAQRLLAELQPDLLIYGVCQNDFLPSGVGQYTNNQAWRVPVPEPILEAVQSRSRLAALTSDVYGSLLIRAGIRRDFYGDILAQPESAQTRFAGNVQQLARLAAETTGRPLLAMVLDQAPRRGSAGALIAQRAEAALADAGAEWIPSERFYRLFDGIRFRVSPWEGHPNEIAHAVWARWLSEAVIERYLGPSGWSFGPGPP